MWASPGLIARFNRDDPTQLLQATGQSALDQLRSRFVTPGRARRVQMFDLFDDLAHHTRTRLFQPNGRLAKSA